MTAAAAARPGRIRPIYAALAALVLGIVATPIANALLLAFVGIVVVIAFFFAAVPRSPLRLRPALVPVLLLLPFLVWGTAAARRATTPAADDISRLTGGPSVRVHATVVSDVDSGTRGVWRFTVAVSAVDDYRRIRPASGNLRVTQRLGTPPCYGEQVWLRGRIEAPPGATNPGSFDYRAYLARRGIFATLTARRAEDVRRTGLDGASPVGRAAAWIRAGTQRETRAHLPAEAAALLDGLLLSIRGRLPADVEDAFTRTGAVHLLSTSGLHLGALAMALFYLLPRIGLSRRTANGLAIVVIWTYAAAAGGGPAPVRSALMLSVALAAPLLRREAESLHSLAFAAIVILLASPLALYDAGTQLSFVTVGALLVWIPPLERRLPPKEAGMSWREKAKRYALLGLAASSIAHLASAPLVAHHFNLFSVVAPLANLPLILVSNALLLTGLSAVGFSMLLPPIAEWLTLPLWGMLGAGLWLLRWLTLWFAAMPFAAVSVASPPVVAVALFYLLLFGGGLLVRRHFGQTRFFAPAAPHGDDSGCGGVSAAAPVAAVVIPP